MNLLHLCVKLRGCDGEAIQGDWSVILRGKNNVLLKPSLSDVLANKDRNRSACFFPFKNKATFR